jgi:hypothetical protein
MRQRLDAKGAELRDLTDGLSLRLLERTEAPITPHKGYIRADLDTFVMDQPAGRRTPRSGGPERSEGFGAAEHNSDTKKKAVSRTYQGVDGYTSIALCLGNEGWSLGLELRAGSHHSALETGYFLERAFPRLERLCASDAKVLWRDDSGFAAGLQLWRCGTRAGVHDVARAIVASGISVTLDIDMLQNRDSRGQKEYARQRGWK